MTSEKTQKLEKNIIKILAESDHHLSIPTDNGHVLATRIDNVYKSLNELFGENITNRDSVHNAVKNLHEKGHIHMEKIVDRMYLALSSSGKSKYKTECNY